MFWQIASPPSRRIFVSALLLIDEERVLEQRLPGWEEAVVVEGSVRRFSEGEVGRGEMGAISNTRFR